MIQGLMRDEEWACLEPFVIEPSAQGTLSEGSSPLFWSGISESRGPALPGAIWMSISKTGRRFTASSCAGSYLANGGGATRSLQRQQLALPPVGAAITAQRNMVERRLDSPPVGSTSSRTPADRQPVATRPQPVTSLYPRHHNSTVDTQSCFRLTGKQSKKIYPNKRGILIRCAHGNPNINSRICNPILHRTRAALRRTHSRNCCIGPRHIPCPSSLSQKPAHSNCP